MTNTAPRRCYWISATDFDADGFIPAVVEEGVAGYRLLSGVPAGRAYHWGKTYEEAREVAAECNRVDFGLTPREASDIVLSSMLAGNPWR